MRVALGLLVVVLGAVLKAVGTSNGHTSALGTVGIVLIVLGVLAMLVALMRSGPRRRAGASVTGRASSHSGLSADPVDPNL